MRIEEIQAALLDQQLDGWLFYDHHHRDPLAYHILGLGAETHVTRRWYYFIPSHDEPRGLVHRIEPHALNGLPGAKAEYSRWTDQRERLTDMLAGARVVAMQHSPDCAIPYVAMVDAGTVDLVRSIGVEVRSSADLVQLFEARWSDEQLFMHLEAGRKMDGIRKRAFDFLRDRQCNRVPVTEWDIRSHVLEEFRVNGLVTDHGPIVAVNANASDPHYEPTAAKHSPIQPGDVVLIDMWAKLEKANAVFYDITWTGYCGQEIPSDVQNVFRVVTEARDIGIARVLRSAEERTVVRGYEVDDAVRNHIDSRGFGQHFIHRTGHSIGTEVHGAGANIDNYETHDERRILARTCFSIEPGIYLPHFGIRSEVNVYVADADAQVTGEIQRELIRLA